MEKTKELLNEIQNYQEINDKLKVEMEQAKESKFGQSGRN